MAPLQRDVVAQRLEVVRCKGEHDLKGRRELLNIRVAVAEHGLQQVIDRRESLAQLAEEGSS